MSGIAVSYLHTERSHKRYFESMLKLKPNVFLHGAGFIWAICTEGIKILIQLVAAFAVFFIKDVYDHFARLIFILRLSLRSFFIFGFLFGIFFQLTLFDVLIGQVFFSDILPLDD